MGQYKFKWVSTLENMGFGERQKRSRDAKNLCAKKPSCCNRFAKEVLPAYGADDGPLTGGDLTRIRKAAEPRLPKGKVINTRSLL